MLNLLCDTKSAFIEHRQLCAAKAENKQSKHKTYGFQLLTIYAILFKLSEKCSHCFWDTQFFTRIS